MMVFGCVRMVSSKVFLCIHDILRHRWLSINLRTDATDHTVTTGGRSL